MNKRTWAEINVDALKHNFSIVRKKTDQKAKVCCIVKAGAYGHGALPVAKLFEKIGADYLGVATLDEANELREGGVTLPILILGYTDPKFAKILSDLNIDQCVYSSEYADELADFAEKENVKIKIHVKIDTGMSRLGYVFDEEKDNSDILSEIERICKRKCFITEGIFTHFCVSDEGESGKEYTMKQLSNFLSAIDELKKRGIEFKIRHCANSAAIEEYPETHLDMVRAGLILYGFGNDPGFISAMKMKSTVSMVKFIEKGDTVGYGRKFTADEKIKVATVPVGYADGYFRSNSQNGSKIYIGGSFCRILGNICMDQLMVDVTGLDVKIGDEVTVFGEKENSALDIANLNNTIVYEVICAVSKRVPRIYIEN